MPPSRKLLKYLFLFLFQYIVIFLVVNLFLFVRGGPIAAPFFVLIGYDILYDAYFFNLNGVVLSFVFIVLILLINVRILTKSSSQVISLVLTFFSTAFFFGVVIFVQAYFENNTIFYSKSRQRHSNCVDSCYRSYGPEISREINQEYNNEADFKACLNECVNRQ